MIINKNNSREQNINWPEISKRLETTKAAMDRVINPTVEDKRKVLRERAAILALEKYPDNSGQEIIDFLEFMLAGERYGIEIKFIREVYPLKRLVPVPGSPSYILGITSVRGQMIAVIELKRFFNLPDKGLTELDKVIILQVGDDEIGIRADSIQDLRSVTAAKIQHSLVTLHGVRERYLHGVSDEAVIIIDAKKLIDDFNAAESLPGVK